MKTKAGRKAPGRTETFTVGPNGPDSKEPEQVSESTKPKERFQLSFDLNDDGTPDLSSMRGRTKERVQEFFSNRKMAEAFGVKEPVTPEVQIFHPSMVAGLYSLLGSVETMIIIRGTKIPEEIAKQVFPYKPIEVEALSPLTAKVLNKYAADWMIKYQDELALLSMLAGMTVTKFNVAYAMMKMQAATPPPAKSQEETEEKDEKKVPVQ